MSDIRLAGMGDFDRVCTIVKDAVLHMNEQGIFQWDDVYPDRCALQQDIQKEQMFVITEDSSTAGFITLNEEQSEGYEKISWEYTGRVLVVHRLTIAPENQGKKLASKLMQFTEKYALSSGYETIRLDAFIRNSVAIGLYKKCGYRNAGSIEFRKGLFYCFEKSLLMP